MGGVTRRGALLGTAGVGLGTGLAAAQTGAAPKAGGAGQAERDPAERKADFDRVVACGMTEAEAECWETVADAAGKFFALPELHPMDRQEVATAIHVIQNKLLGRPVYRQYKGLGKAAAAKATGSK
jgi:hypothetical protein